MGIALRTQQSKRRYGGGPQGLPAAPSSDRSRRPSFKCLTTALATGVPSPLFLLRERCHFPKLDSNSPPRRSVIDVAVCGRTSDRKTKTKG